jgi:ethanolamine utilization protein EutN
VKLARVVGTVVSTINVPVYEDRKLLLCDLVEPSGRAAGGYLIAVDVVGAGAGETVLLMDEGNSARQILQAPEAPVRTLLVGIVDHVEAPGAGSVPEPPTAAPPVDGEAEGARGARGARTTARRAGRPKAR